MKSREREFLRSLKTLDFPTTDSDYCNGHALLISVVAVIGMISHDMT